MWSQMMIIQIHLNKHINGNWRDDERFDWNLRRNAGSRNYSHGNQNPHLPIPFHQWALFCWWCAKNLITTCLCSWCNPLWIQHSFIISLWEQLHPFTKCFIHYLICIFAYCQVILHCWVTFTFQKLFNVPFLNNTHLPKTLHILNSSQPLINLNN